MAGQSFIDQRTGKPIFIREGQAFLKDRNGNLFQVNPDASADDILSGEFEPASMEDVQRRDLEKRTGATGGRAFAESAAAGAFDAATALPRTAAFGVQKVAEAAGAPLQGPGVEEVSGRKLLAAMAGEGSDPLGEQYAEEARFAAQESPGAALGGRVLGEIAGGAVSPLGRATSALGGEAAGATLPRVAAAGVAEGATLGYAQANEDAYIQNRELTAEQALAGMGLGAVFGGGVALGTAGAARVFGRKASRGATPFDSPKLGPYRTQAEALEQAASSSLGTPAAPGLGSKLSDALESAQSAVSGAEKGTLKSFGAHRWDDAAVRGRDLWRNREGILEGASKAMREDLDTLATSSRDVMDEVVDADLKREHIAAKLPATHPAGSTDISRQLREGAIPESEWQYLRGGDKPSKPLDKAYSSGADPTDIATGRVIPEGSREPVPPIHLVIDSGEVHLRDGTKRLAWARKNGATEIRAVIEDAATGSKAERVIPIPPETGVRPGGASEMVAAARREMAQLRAEVDEVVGDVATYGNRGVAKRVKQFVGELADEADRTDDAASAFITLDRAKRGIQRWRKQLGRSAARSDDALLRQQSETLGRRFEAMQERTRNVLMDEKLWGAAAADQRAINAAWENWFQSRNVFHGNFLLKTGESFDGRGIYAADPSKISRYVRTLGRQEGSLVDEQFRHHVIATRNLSDAVDKAFDVGDKSARVKAVRAAAEQIEKTLAKADETVKVANQIDAVIQAESGSGAQLFNSAVGGGIVGGLPGAVIGAAAGVLSRPGQLIKQAAAVQALSNNVGARMRKSIGAYFKDFSAPKLPSAGGAVKRLPARRTVTAAGIASFAKPGEDKRTAYARRAREVMDAVREPQSAAAKMKEALGPLNQQTPKLAGMMGAKAIAGAAFLAKKIDRPLREPSLTPHLEEPTASDSEIADFARYWSAVSNPMSLMDELKSGTLTHEHVEAVQAVYPRLFSEMQRTVMDELAQLKKPPPYQARLQLDMLMGLDGGGEESVSPGFLLRQQQRSQAVPPPPPGAQRSAGPRRPMESSAKFFTTGSQALEARDRNR